MRNPAIFSFELFPGEEFREKHLSTTLFPVIGCGFINPPPPFGFFSFPRKESFDLNRKKKAPKKRTRFGRKFPPEWAKILSRSISRNYLIT